MKICDFCSTAKILMDFIGESKNINQIDFMYELFKDFMESDEAKDFDFDNGLVCRWLNGTAKLSPKITAYYSALGNLEAMAIDIEENIIQNANDRAIRFGNVYAATITVNNNVMLIKATKIFFIDIILSF